NSKDAALVDFFALEYLSCCRFFACHFSSMDEGLASVARGAACAKNEAALYFQDNCTRSSKARWDLLAEEPSAGMLTLSRVCSCAGPCVTTGILRFRAALKERNYVYIDHRD